MDLVLVTGATDGIGRQTVRDLVRGGAHVVVHGRRPDRIAAVQAELERDAPGHCVGTLCADLGDLDQVRRMAREARGRFSFSSLRVLVNNAGIYPTERALSADGFERTLAINHLAPFLLTHLLLPELRRPVGARIVNVSSIAHTRGRLHRDDLDLARSWDPYAAYAQSKLCNILFTRELARRLGPTVGHPETPRVYALHPGVVSTKLLKTGFDIDGPDSLQQGAATTVWLATSDEVADDTGWYYVSRQRAPTVDGGLSAHALDEDDARWLYQESCRRVGIEPLPEPPPATRA